MTAYASFDRSTFPIITVAFTGEKATPENFQVYLDGLRENYDREETFSLIFDATKATAPGASYQKQQANWMKENDELIRTYCKGIAYVIPNLIIRNILKLILGLQKDAVPSKVFSSKEEGLTWAKSML